MTAANYPACLRKTLAYEGGNDDDPRDPGGRTSRGIIQREWDAYRVAHPHLPADVWQAPQSAVEDIYRRQYWATVKGDDLPAGVDLAVFDYGVNSGVSHSAKVLQRVVGVTADGKIGPITLAAVSAKPAESIVAAICDERLAFLRVLHTWPTFGKGWGRRVADVRSTALAMRG